MSVNEKSMRLNKALSHAGLCARRKADELIFAGAVRVNGEVVAEPGRRVDLDRDRIDVNGVPLAASAPPCHLMLHKPVRVVSTARDPEGRTTVLDLVPPAWRGRRLYPVGRLDFFSEGLLVLTDDGELANLLAHPRHHLPRRYLARVRGAVSGQVLDAMRRGMTLSEGERLARVEVEAEARGRDTELRMTLRQGINRQIRRMCRDMDLTILRLVRVGLGPLELGDLAPGAVRELAQEEVAALRQAAGQRQ
jgi:23S rRNA pseudouridine2605 synthase